MNSNLRAIIDICPFSTEFSKFEQESFLQPSSPGYSRYMIGLINRYRKLASDLEQETRTFEKQVMLEEKQKIETLLNEQDSTRLQSAISNWENLEEDYWVDTLGKISAIEILTYGKLTYDTMLKMAKLPEDCYIRATQVCVRLASTIKQKTIDAEVEIGVEQSQPFDDLDPGLPKKLLLKKTK